MVSYNFDARARAQPEWWEALEQAGIKVDPYDDLQNALFVGLGGQYIDVGTSAKIADGKIKIKSDAKLKASHPMDYFLMMVRKSKPI